MMHHVKWAHLWVAAVMLVASPMLQGEPVRIGVGFTGYFAGVLRQVVVPSGVSCTVETYDSYRSAGAAARSGKGLPDLIHLSEFASPDIFAQIQRGESHPFIPVQTVAPELGQLRFLADLGRAYSLGEKLWALPFNPSMGIAFYNRTAFTRSGLDPDKPLTTWAELIAAARQLKRAGYVPFIFPWLAAYTYEYLASIHGLPVTNGVHGLAGEQPTRFQLAANPAFETFFADLRQWHREGLWEIVGDGLSAEVEQRFGSGEVAILMQGSGRRPLIEKAIGGKFELTAGPLPWDSRWAKERHVPKIGGGAFWATRNTPEVRRVLRHLASPSALTKWVKETGYLPPTEDVASALASSGHLAQQPHLAQALDQAHWALSPYIHLRVPRYDHIRGPAVFERLLRAFLAGEIGTARDFVRRFDEEATAVIEPSGP